MNLNSTTKEPVRFSAREQVVMDLYGLLCEDSDYGEDTVLTFSQIAEEGGLPVAQVRRTVRQLARKGMVKLTYTCDEAYRISGSGYWLTREGKKRRGLWANVFSDQEKEFFDCHLSVKKYLKRFDEPHPVIIQVHAYAGIMDVPALRNFRPHLAKGLMNGLCLKVRGNYYCAFKIFCLHNKSKFDPFGKGDTLVLHCVEDTWRQGNLKKAKALAKRMQALDFPIVALEKGQHAEAFKTP